MTNPTISVIAPVFNEAAGIVEFCKRLRGVLSQMQVPYEVVFVDDGSTDGSAEAILELQWEQCKVVQLMRNAGHQCALEAGLSVATGSLLITMDSDGQHPPSLIPEMMRLAVSGNLDVVYTKRMARQEDGLLKRAAALGYYRIARILTGIDIPDSQADFRLISRRVCSDIAQVPGDKVLRLLLPSIGYSSRVLTYEALPRIAGVGRFGFRRQIGMASSTAIGFSAKPLRLVASMALVLALVAFIWLIVVFVTFLATRTVDGWASVMTAVLLVGSLTLLSLAIVGEYLARIHDLIKGHPRYAINQVLPSPAGRRGNWMSGQ
jgi:glycosyltransferase involved in cell wall biosynthesis